MKKKRKGVVLVPVGYKPSEDELWAAHIIAAEYSSKIEFIEPDGRYARHTADILVNGVPHEIKTPVSEKTENVYKLLRAGAKQAGILIINARKTPLSTDRLKRISLRILDKKRNVNEIIIIDSHEGITRLKR